MLSTMIRLVLLALVASSAMATDCDTLKACYLRDLSTDKEIKLTGDDSYDYDSSNSHHRGYSIRCTVNGVNGTESHFITYFWEDKNHTEWNEPRWMRGDSDKGEYINAVEYLSSCGKKKVWIEGHVWSNICFKKTYNLTAQCPPTAAPVAPPRVTPVEPPKAAPVPAPVEPPKSPPRTAPVEPPKSPPVDPPKSPPVDPPKAAPVVPPVVYYAPVEPPKAAPVPAPVAAPLPKPPTTGDSPVAAPAVAPKAVTPAPKAATPAPKAATPAPKTPVAPPVDAPKAAAPTGTAPTPMGSAPVPVSPPKAYAPAAAPVKAPTGKTCKPGYKLVSNCCVKDDCKTDFQCPARMERIPNKDCYKSMQQCKCKKGYVKRMMWFGRRGSRCRRKLLK